MTQVYKHSPLVSFCVSMLATQSSMSFNLLVEYSSKTQGLTSFQCSFFALFGGLIALSLVGLFVPSIRRDLFDAIGLLCHGFGCFDHPENADWPALMVSSIIPDTAVITLSFALFFLNTGDATALYQASRLIFTAMLAPLLFSERVPILDIFRILACIIGVVFIAQPESIFGNDPETKKSVGGSARSSIAGLVCGLLTGIQFATGNASVRRLGGRNTPSVVMAARFLGGSAVVMIALIVNLIVEWADPSIESPLHWPMIDLDSWKIIVIIVSMSAMSPFVSALYISAFSYGDLNQVTLVANSSLITSFIFQALLFGEILDYLTYIGGILVFFASIAAPLIAMVTHKNADHSTDQERKDIELSYDRPATELDPILVN